MCAVPCSAYESFNAAVGLLGIYNDAILSEQPGQQQDVASWAFWLAAVEQVRARTHSHVWQACLNSCSTTGHALRLPGKLLDAAGAQGISHLHDLHPPPSIPPIARWGSQHASTAPTGSFSITHTH